MDVYFSHASWYLNNTIYFIFVFMATHLKSYGVNELMKTTCPFSVFFAKRNDPKSQNVFKRSGSNVAV